MNKIPPKTTTFDLVFITLIFIGAGFLFSGIVGGFAMNLTGTIVAAYIATAIVIIIDILLYIRVIKEEYAKWKDWKKWESRRK